MAKLGGITKQTEGGALERLAVDRLAAAFGRLDLTLRRPSRLVARAYADDHDVSSADLLFELRAPDEPRPVLVQILSRLSVDRIPALRSWSRSVRARNPGAIPLLFVPRIGEEARAELRRSRINYADLRGTVSIREPGVWIEVSGQGEEVRWRGPSGTVNPFSDKASLPLRVLFRDTTRAWRVSDLARETGVTKGWISILGRALVDAGYVARTEAGFRMGDPARVLHDWTSAYSWRRNRMASFYSALDHSERLDRLRGIRAHASQWALTLLAGSSLAAPHVEHEQLHLYVEASASAPLEERLRKSLYLEPTESGGNVHLLRPYYATSALFDSRRVAELPVVSPLQLYLDLFQFPVRGREAADVVLRTELARSAHLSPDQVAALL